MLGVGVDVHALLLAAAGEATPPTFGTTVHGITAGADLVAPHTGAITTALFGVTGLHRIGVAAYTIAPLAAFAWIAAPAAGAAVLHRVDSRAGRAPPPVATALTGTTDGRAATALSRNAPAGVGASLATGATMRIVTQEFRPTQAGVPLAVGAIAIADTGTALTHAPGTTDHIAGTTMRRMLREIHRAGGGRITGDQAGWASTAACDTDLDGGALVPTGTAVLRVVLQVAFLATAAAFLGNACVTTAPLPFSVTENEPLTALLGGHTAHAFTTDLGASTAPIARLVDHLSAVAPLTQAPSAAILVGLIAVGIALAAARIQRRRVEGAARQQERHETNA